MVSGAVFPLLLLCRKLFAMLPLSVSYRVMDLLSLLVPFFIKTEMSRMSTNLSMAMPEISASERNVVINGALKHFGRSLAEILLFDAKSVDSLLSKVEVHGLEIIQEEMKKGRGAIMITAHLGNWELLGAFLTSRGLPLKVVATRSHNRKINELLVYLRKSRKVETIYRHDSPRQMLKALKNNCLLGMLIDQDTKVDGVFVDFFGQPAYTAKGPAVLSMATGAPVIPTFIRRTPEGGHEVFIEEPVEMEKTKDKEKDILINTQKLSRIIEKYIRKYPEQWVWMHNRWKTRP